MVLSDHDSAWQRKFPNGISIGRTDVDSKRSVNGLQAGVKTVHDVQLTSVLVVFVEQDFEIQIS